MQYDPVLHAGYAEDQALEPDLAAAQEAILWADHLVCAFPVWWGGMPAKMKGFFDRAFLPGFAYRYHEHGPGWDRLLGGRSARLLVTMTSPPLFYRLVHGAPAHKQLERAILGFCGVGPVETETFGGLDLVQERQRRAWLDKAFDLGLKDARRTPPRRPATQEAQPALTSSRQS
jgi:putative NADPH-quinone reductase